MSQRFNNIVLIGMPGSGKSALGKRAATTLACGYIDVDERIEREAKEPIPEIFEREGETGFRARETAELEKLYNNIDSKTRHIIATGGGVVTVPENLALLRALGLLIYIKRDLRTIADSVSYQADRPLLRDGAKLLELWQTRKQLYEDWADIVFVNDGACGPERAAERLAKTISGC